MSLSKDLLEKINKLIPADTNESVEVAEAAPRKFVSMAGGVRHIKLDCPPGYKIEGQTCVAMTATEKRALKIGAKKAKITKRPKQALISRARAITMKKRKAAGL